VTAWSSSASPWLRRSPRRASGWRRAACRRSTTPRPRTTRAGISRWRRPARKAGQLAGQHARLAAAIAGIGEAEGAEAAEADYFYLYLPEHLHEAGDRAALVVVLLDGRLASAADDKTIRLWTPHQRRDRPT
jgi:hypothetical protein